MPQLSSIADATGSLSSTVADAAVSLIAASDDLISRVTFVNEGAVAGYGKIGSKYYRIPAAAAATAPVSITIPFPLTPIKNPGISIVRQAGGSNMTGCWAYAT